MKLFDIVKCKNAVVYSDDDGARALYDIDRIPDGGNYELIYDDDVKTGDIPREVLEVAAEGVPILKHGEPVKMYRVKSEDNIFYDVYGEPKD